MITIGRKLNSTQCDNKYTNIFAFAQNTGLIYLFCFHSTIITIFYKNHFILSEPVIIGRLIKYFEQYSKKLINATPLELKCAAHILI